MTLLKSSIKSCFGALGLEIKRRTPSCGAVAEPPFSTLQEVLLLFQASGFSPTEIYDIGANRGSWTRSVLRIFPSSSYLLVEPQEHLRGEVADLLANPRIGLLHCAVSDHSGHAKFSRSSWDVTSHLVTRENSEKSEDNEQVFEIEVMTIGDLMAKRGKVPDLIKIDAEGFDLQVIEGAREAFGKTEMFLVEAGLASQSMKNDVITVVNRMDAAGYRLAAVTDINTYQWPPQSHSPGLQWLADLAFLRKDGAILAALREPKRDRIKVVRW